MGEGGDWLIKNYYKKIIVDGKLEPGQKLNVDSLSKDMKVSKIPIREALMRLQQAGLVQYKPNRGMQVAGINKKELVRLLDIKYG